MIVIINTKPNISKDIFTHARFLFSKYRKYSVHSLKLTSHLHLEPRLNTRGATLVPPTHLHGAHRDNNARIYLPLNFHGRFWILLHTRNTESFRHI